jgi:hypothetical protein
MPRKHASHTKQTACLLQHYCPFCFKGKIGTSCGLRVDRYSPLVDEVQVMHSSRGNGLCPLDFRYPGEFCVNSKLCRLVCLVCGKTTVDGTDPEFELFCSLFGGESSEDEESVCPVTLKYEIHDAMQTHHLVWTEQWDTPIHKGCSMKASCRCVLALGTTFCPKHKFALSRDQSTRKMRSGQGRDEGFNESKQSMSLRDAPKTMPVTSGDNPRVVPKAVTVKASMEKASWLPPATKTALVVHYNPPIASNGHLGRKTVTNPNEQSKNMPGNSKTNIKKARLELDASKCAYKLDTWTATHPTNQKLKGPAGEECGSSKDLTQAAQKGGFSLENHYKLFDPAIHGAWKKNGVKGYVRYDGVFIPTSSDVNILHEDGTLTPG